MKILQKLVLVILTSGFLACTNNMDQLYIVSASHNALPTGTPIDEDGDGHVDGLDLTGDGIIEMRFVAPIGIPVTGIDINNDETADFYLYTSKTGSTFNTSKDGTGSTVTTVIQNGVVQGYDTTGDGIVDIGTAGNTVYKVNFSASGVLSSMIVALTVNNSSYEYKTISADGTYAFNSSLNNGNFYQVSIVSGTQQCTMSNDSGVINLSDVTGISITCGTLQVKVAVTGPAGPFTLIVSLTIDNTTNATPLTITTPTTLGSEPNFNSFLKTGSLYNVLIVSTSIPCKFSGTNTDIMAGSDVTVNIDCAQYTVDNTTQLITGFTGGDITLSLSINGSFVESKTVTFPATSFAFSTPLYAGDAYSVQILSSTQDCKISQNTGTISTITPLDKTDVKVVCAQDQVVVTLNHTADTGLGLNKLSYAIILSLTVNGVTVENITVPANANNLSTHPFSSLLFGNDVYNVQIVSSTENCKLKDNIGTAPGTGTIATQPSIDCGSLWIRGNLKDSLITPPDCETSIGASLIVEINGSPVPVTLLSVTAAAPNVPYAFDLDLTPPLYFNSGDVYTLSLANYSASGTACSSQCSFIDVGTGTGLSAVSGTITANTTIDVFCW